MTKRVFLAGLLGGIAMYVWTAIAHMVLPLGEAGIKEIPNEPAVIGTMRSSLGDSSGLYLFPGMGLGPDATSQRKQAAMMQYSQKLAVGPSGIVMYHPPGMQALAPRQFIAEFVKELIEALLAACSWPRRAWQRSPRAWVSWLRWECWRQWERMFPIGTGTASRWRIRLRT